MNPSPTSAEKLHRIVEYVKQVGFDLETDELAVLGVQPILRGIYDIYIDLSEAECLVLFGELHDMAAANEIREGQVKYRELYPEDRGVELLREKDADGLDKATCYAVPYAYPVGAALRDIQPIDRSSSRFSKKKPDLSGLDEVMDMETKNEPEDREDFGEDDDEVAI